MSKQDEFDDKPAVRRALSLMVAFISPSGGGKTLSALRIATGMQRVTGGEIFVVDTENDRSLYYADDFKFRQVSFQPPFNPERYLRAAEHCVAKGAKIIIFDSASPEHDGIGGVLEMFEAEFAKHGRKESMRLLSWGPAKMERRHVMHRMTRLNAHVLFCFRAKDKIKMKERGEQGDAVKKLGYVAVTDDDLLFEIPTRFLLLPGADGHPTWKSEMVGERLQYRCPRQFRPMFEDDVQLSEDIGERMARWAAGDSAPAGNATLHGTAPQPNGPVFHWKSNAEWHEKPLRSAPLEALNAYRTTIKNGIATTKNERVADTMRSWLTEVDTEIEAAEADAAMADATAAE